MTFELSECAFVGPALPEPFMRFEMEAALTKRNLLPPSSGARGQATEVEIWVEPGAVDPGSGAILRSRREGFMLD